MGCNEISVIRKAANTLIGLADRYAVNDNVHIKYDLDMDGSTDDIYVKYDPKEYKYQFAIRFAKKSAECSRFMTDAPFSFNREVLTRIVKDKKAFVPPKDIAKFYVKDSKGKITAQIDWHALRSKHSRLVLGLLHKGMQHLAPAFALLFRSPRFRAMLDHATTDNYTFALDSNTNMYLDPAQKKFYINPSIKITDFLFTFPHELAHQYNISEDTATLKSFIDDYVMNEVRPYEFAIKIMDEIAVTPDIMWSDYPRYRAYKDGGKNALEKEVRKTVSALGLTYVEQASLLYVTNSNSIEDLRRVGSEFFIPRFKLSKSWKQWAAFIQTSIYAKMKDPAAIIASSEAQKVLNSFPILNEHVNNRYDQWIEIIALARRKNNVDAAERQIIETLGVLSNEYYTDGFEQIRIKNAKELEIEQYY